MAERQPFTPQMREALIWQIIADPSLSGVGVRVGVFLATKVHRDEWIAWPSLQTICDACGIPEKGSVQKGVRQLRGKHFRVERAGGRYGFNRYHPLIQEASKWTPQDDDGTGQGVQMDTGGRPNGLPACVQMDALYPDTNPEKDPEAGLNFSELGYEGSTASPGSSPQSVSSPPVEFARQAGGASRGGASLSADLPLLPFIAGQIIQQSRIEGKRGTDSLDRDKLRDSFVASLDQSNPPDGLTLKRRFRGYVRAAIDRADQAHRIEGERALDAMIDEARRK